MEQELLPRVPLSDGLVTLRAFDERDTERIVAACSDPLTRKFLPDLPDPYTTSSATEWLRGHEQARHEGTSLTSAVAEETNGLALGSLTAVVDENQRSTELGYWLVPDARGRGFMTRAVRLLSAWLVSEIRLERLEILTEPSNAASGAVTERCGSRREGHLRSHLRDHTGARRDTLVWGLLPDELR